MKLHEQLRNCENYNWCFCLCIVYFAVACCGGHFFFTLNVLYGAQLSDNPYFVKSKIYNLTYVNVFFFFLEVLHTCFSQAIVLIKCGGVGWKDYVGTESIDGHWKKTRRGRRFSSDTVTESHVVCTLKSWSPKSQPPESSATKGQARSTTIQNPTPLRQAEDILEVL